MMLVYFTSSGCVDDTFNNLTTYQLALVIFIHFIMAAGAC